MSSNKRRKLIADPAPTSRVYLMLYICGQSADDCADISAVAARRLRINAPDVDEQKRKPRQNLIGSSKREQLFDGNFLAKSNTITGVLSTGLDGNTDFSKDVNGGEEATGQAGHLSDDSIYEDQENVDSSTE